MIGFIVLIISEPFFDAVTLNMKYRNVVNAVSIHVPDLLFPFGVSTDIASSSINTVVGVFVDLSLRV